MRFIFVLSFTLLVVNADQEHEAHGSASAKFRYEHEGAGHNQHADHKAVLGNSINSVYFEFILLYVPLAL